MENQRSTIVTPKDIVLKHFTKVHNEVLSIIEDTCITRFLIVRFHCKIQSSKSCKHNNYLFCNVVVKVQLDEKMRCKIITITAYIIHHPIPVLTLHDIVRMCIK